MRPTLKALFGVILVVSLWQAEPTPGQSLGFESLGAAKGVGAQTVFATTHTTGQFSALEIELPSTTEASVAVFPENFAASDCSSSNLASPDSGASLAAFMGFFQEDGTVNCERITLFDRLAEVGVKPFAFAVAAGTITIAALGILSSDDNPAGRFLVREPLTPIPEPATLLLLMLSAVMVASASRHKLR